MASTNNGGGEEQQEELKKLAELSKTLKEGERILAPTRRPDGTLRKPIRIRAGYVPQDEVAIYQSKGSLLKKEMASNVPPGFEPAPDMKSKTKSVKRNERKKEKRLQAALEKGKNLGEIEGDCKKEELVPLENSIDCGSESVNSLASQVSELAVSANPGPVIPPDSTEDSNPGDPIQDIDKQIRALKKKFSMSISLLFPKVDVKQYL
ncbi:partner of Y14 and mago isoform X2 [Morus notabilis]|uniref:partner of Y14 and mago isoform X2 n=1 Tax=Morus notabilis TaxID=981085 RepID=UPI000CECE45F|nr:partner of Y14 and mago isoform X2 [Morus notabilis]